jgi:hypothetical protein
MTRGRELRIYNQKEKRLFHETKYFKTKKAAARLREAVFNISARST